MNKKAVEDHSKSNQSHKKKFGGKCETCPNCAGKKETHS